ncbi:MAG: tyrosine--tRNA ligase [Chloroflexota bacterium]|nr:tyrosine--tRNA ligase [Chloroflexota bacterium]
MNQTIDEQLDILMRGVEYGDPQTYEYMRAELKTRLQESAETGKPLRVYCGYDPTAPDLHLGHTVTMRKLRQFQDLGHQAIFLIGTYTALIGDPSDKDKARPRPDKDKIIANAKTYTEQAFRILAPERTEVRYNGEWLSELAFEDLINLAANFTVQQFLARDNFAKRHQKNEPIWLHEFFYALMQGYDAVALEADVQLGATEQLFNLMAGRKLQETFGQPPQIAVTLPILVGTDGHIRMSKSMGNYIGISEPAEVMYGKVMSLPDEAMLNYFNLVTRWTPSKIATLEEHLAVGKLHPMQAKKDLAWEIADIFHGTEAANKAAKHFARVHQRREKPVDMPTFKLHAPMLLIDIIAEAGLAGSKSQARRLIQQGGVRLDDVQIKDLFTTVEPGEQVLRVGKRRFLQLLSREG